MSAFNDLITAYRDQMIALLPTGRAWSRAPQSIMARLLFAFAEEFARFHVRTENLINEADPATSLEMLTDWERVAGLPDDCLPVTGTVKERQQRVLRKVVGIGGQSAAFFIEQAAQLGLDIEIEQLAPFRIGQSRVGQPLNGPEWQFVWRVKLLPFSEATGLVLRDSWFRVGQSRVGDRLRSFSVAELECVIRRAAPAHTKILFSYPVDPEPIMWFDFLSDNGAY